MGKCTFAHGAKVWMFDAQNENCARRSCHCFFSDPIDATTAITAFLVGQPVGVCPVKRLSNGPPLDFGKIFLEYRQRFFGTIERLILLAAGFQRAEAPLLDRHNRFVYTFPLLIGIHLRKSGDVVVLPQVHGAILREGAQVNAKPYEKIRECG